MKPLSLVPLLLSAIAAVAAAACAAPSVEQRPLPTDFAFVEIQLLG